MDISQSSSELSSYVTKEMRALRYDPSFSNKSKQVLEIFSEYFESEINESNDLSESYNPFVNLPCELPDPVLENSLVEINQISTNNNLDLGRYLDADITKKAEVEPKTTEEKSIR